MRQAYRDLRQRPEDLEKRLSMYAYETLFELGYTRIFKFGYIAERSSIFISFC
jgi:hypothetical protein